MFRFNRVTLFWRIIHAGISAFRFRWASEPERAGQLSPNARDDIAEAGTAQAAMRQLYALESDLVGSGPQFRPGPLHGESLFEIPPHYRDVASIEQVDCAVLALDCSLHDLLMPSPEPVDLRQPVLEHKWRVFGWPGETVDEIVLPASR